MTSLDSIRAAVEKDYVESCESKCRWPKRKLLARAKQIGVGTAERLWRDLAPCPKLRESANSFALLARSHAMTGLFLSLPGKVEPYVTEYCGDAAAMRAVELFHGADTTP